MYLLFLLSRGACEHRSRAVEPGDGVGALLGVGGFLSLETLQPHSIREEHCWSVVKHFMLFPWCVYVVLWQFFPMVTSLRRWIPFPMERASQ